MDCAFVPVTVMDQRSVKMDINCSPGVHNKAPELAGVAQATNSHCKHGWQEEDTRGVWKQERSCTDCVNYRAIHQEVIKGPQQHLMRTVTLYTCCLSLSILHFIAKPLLSRLHMLRLHEFGEHIQWANAVRCECHSLRMSLHVPCDRGKRLSAS